MKKLLNLSKLMSMFDKTPNAPPPALSPLGQTLKTFLVQKIQLIFAEVENNPSLSPMTEFLKAPLMNILNSFDEKTIISIVGFVTQLSKDLQAIIKDHQARQAVQLNAHNEAKSENATK